MECCNRKVQQGVHLTHPYCSMFYTHQPSCYVRTLKTIGEEDYLSSLHRQNITPTLKMEEETIKQIELKCPNCNHEMIADFDINELAKVEAHKLLDKAAEV